MTKESAEDSKKTLLNYKSKTVKHKVTGISYFVHDIIVYEMTIGHINGFEVMAIINHNNEMIYATEFPVNYTVI